MDGELDVLGQQMEGPGAGLLQHGPAEEEACAGDGAAGTQQAAGVVEVAALPQEPQGVAGGDPVIAVVFAVAVAGDDIVALREGTVHGGDVTGVQNVVGVKDNVAVEPGGVVLLQMAQQGLEGVALAHLHVIEALIDGGSGAAGNVGGVVGAVVRQHEDVQQTLVIGLAAETADEVGNDGGLVPGTDQHGVVVGRGLQRRRLGSLALGQQPRNGNVQELIGIADKENNGDDVIGHSQSIHKEASFLCMKILCVLEIIVHIGYHMRDRLSRTGSDTFVMLRAGERRRKKFKICSRTGR